MSTRSLPNARAAFESGSLEASRDAHTKKSIAESGHLSGDTSAGQGLFHGALEGLCTSTLLLIASYSSGLPPAAAWRLTGGACAGLAAVRALGSWARHGAAARLYAREREREAWELAHYPEGEVKEMVELWEAWGVPHAAAETAISALMPCTNFFVDLMMSQELKMQPPDALPWAPACATGLGFAAFAALPLLAAWLLPHAAAPAAAPALALALPHLALPALAAALALGLLEALHAFALPAQYASKERRVARALSLLILALAAAAGLATARLM